jgi:hypothetical protein
MSPFDIIGTVVIGNEVVRLIGFTPFSNGSWESFGILLERAAIPPHLLDPIGRTAFLGHTSSYHKGIIDMRLWETQLAPPVLCKIPKDLGTAQCVHQLGMDLNKTGKLDQ